MASTYLTRTPSTAGNRKTWTFSAWVKRSGLGGEQNLLAADNNNRIIFSTVDSNDQFGLSDTNTSTMDVQTNQVFRDVSAWYHIVVAFDTTQATASNRVKLYVNGSQVTSLARSNYPTQNADFSINNNTIQNIGRSAAGSSYFDGSMSHIHFIDGAAYDATAFGEVDSTTGQWKINTSPTIADYGTNGFFILKDGNSVTDQSGKGNNFTVGGGTLTKTEDNPSNVFATLNPLNIQSSGFSIGNGNNTVISNTNNTSWKTLYSTLGASTGKFYWEQKITGSNSTAHFIGATDIDKMKNSNANDFEDTNTDAYAYIPDGKIISKNVQSTYGDTWTTNDIIGVALDLDNSKIFFSKNGVWQNSGNPQNGTNPAYTITSGIIYTPATATFYTNNTYQMNFGNGYFGTTAVASAGTNASGIGIFEYDVPTGYTALSTKGLNL